jgi:hypothetical protein
MFVAGDFVLDVISSLPHGGAVVVVAAAADVVVVCC